MGQHNEPDPTTAEEIVVVEIVESLPDETAAPQNPWVREHGGSGGGE